MFFFVHEVNHDRGKFAVGYLDVHNVFHVLAFHPSSADAKAEADLSNRLLHKYISSISTTIAHLDGIHPVFAE